MIYVYCLALKLFYTHNILKCRSMRLTEVVVSSSVDASRHAQRVELCAVPRADIFSFLGKVRSYRPLDRQHVSAKCPGQ